MRSCWLVRGSRGAVKFTGWRIKSCNSAFYRFDLQLCHKEDTRPWVTVIYPGLKLGCLVTTATVCGAGWKYDIMATHNLPVVTRSKVLLLRVPQGETAHERPVRDSLQEVRRASCTRLQFWLAEERLEPSVRL